MILLVVGARNVDLGGFAKGDREKQQTEGQKENKNVCQSFHGQLPIQTKSDTGGSLRNEGGTALIVPIRWPSSG